MLPGCQTQPTVMQLADLAPAEQQYVERFVVLERARAVTLVDSANGHAVLDSLAAAWGDDSLAETRRGLSLEPVRAEVLQDLLHRILAAERDSLVLAPEIRRLTAPLPDPLPQNSPPGDDQR